MTPSHVATIVRRLKANPSAQLESDTLAKLAQGGAVSLDWLATGEGQVLPSFPSADAELSRRIRQTAERPELDLDDDYPTRKVVVKALRGKVEPALLAWRAMATDALNRHPTECALLSALDDAGVWR